MVIGALFRFDLDREKRGNLRYMIAVSYDDRGQP